MPKKLPTDEQLERLAGSMRQGDDSAFDEIVRRYTKPLIGLAVRAHGLNPADAEEVVNDLFMRMRRPKTIRTFDQSLGEFGPFLRTSLRNACRSKHRALKARRDDKPLPDESEEAPNRAGEWWVGLDAIAVGKEEARERDTRARNIRSNGLKETALTHRELFPPNWRQVMERFLRDSFGPEPHPCQTALLSSSRPDAKMAHMHVEVFRRSPPRLEEALRILYQPDTERGFLYWNDAAGRTLQWAEIFAVITTCADAAVRHRFSRKDAAALATAIRLVQRHAPHLLSHVMSPEGIEHEIRRHEAAAKLPWRPGKSTYGPDLLTRQLSSFFRERVAPDRPVHQAIAAFLNATFPSKKRFTAKGVGEKQSRIRHTL